MNYTAIPGKWPYICQNGDFTITGDKNHWGVITAYTRGAGQYTHPLRRYVLAQKSVNMGSYAFFIDVTQKPWRKYFRVPVPYGAA